MGGKIESPDPVDIWVGQNLRETRKRLGISQTKLAQALGTAFQQVQKYERGINRISASRLVAAANCLGVPVADLLPASDLASQRDRVVQQMIAAPGGRVLAERFLALSSEKRELVLRLVKSVE